MWTGFERCSNRNAGSNQQQEALADAEHISTIAGSMGSIGTTESQCAADEALYDTDHTDLNSDFDEAELRRELLKDKWRSVFDQFDPEGFGEIPVEEFLLALQSPALQAHVPINKREQLFERAQKAKEPRGSGSVSFQEFVNVMSGKRSRSFKCAVHQRDREVCSLNDFRHLDSSSSSSHFGGKSAYFHKMCTIIAIEVIPEERDRKYYADNYSCCPPPLFIILITLVELGFFAYNTFTTGLADPSGPLPIDSLFVYRPDKRQEVWRFLFYMFLHAGWFHLGFNLAVQLLVGLPLEMVHGSTRIACIYLAGVLAGSLGTSVFDPEVCLVGASGGVYALLAAHLANVMLNYNQMKYGLLRLTAVFVFASCDFGFAIYFRYSAEATTGLAVSYVAHLTGALAGLTIGFLVLKNFEQKLHEQLYWWIALGVYAACTVFAIVYNVMNTVAAQRFEESEEVIRKQLFHDLGI